MTGRVIYDESCDLPFSTAWFGPKAMFLVSKRKMKRQTIATISG